MSPRLRLLPAIRTASARRVDSRTWDFEGGSRRVWIKTAAIAAAVLLLSPGTGLAQGTYLYSEDTVCPTPFKPLERTTQRHFVHFDVTWTTPRGQWGIAFYTGHPNPVVSDDGKEIWYNPTATVQCQIHWYQLPYGHRDAIFNWHVVEYGGTIKKMDEVCGPGDSYIYDPGYDPSEDGGEVCGGSGEDDGGSGDSGSSANCHTEYLIVEVSYDGGRTWSTYWEGYGTVCG
jgi:hypothetical protein